MVNQHDRSILRELAKRVAEIAALPEVAGRPALWRKHNSLQATRPLILLFPEGAWGELLPSTVFACEEEGTRGMEFDLRHRIYTYEHFRSDNVIEKNWLVGKVIHNSGWGVQAQHRPSTAARGAWAFDPVIKTPADLNKLRYPEIRYDEEATQQRLTDAQELFGDILDVQLKGITHISFHLMNLYSGWRGLEEVMLDMYEEPEMLHDAMAFLEEGHRRMLAQYVELNLLSLNNDNTYHNSGGNGFTDELPLPDYDPRRIRLCDMWGSAEAQEMALVSPEQHAEFILPYERRLLEPFGLTGYGCCEDLGLKLDDVFTLPHLRRISISPFANVDICAEKLQDKYIFSWKPHPAHLVGDFDQDFLRGYIRHTLEVAGHGVLEMILKDTHTCDNHPERFAQWTQIAWEEVERSAGS